MAEDQPTQEEAKDIGGRMLAVEATDIVSMSGSVGGATGVADTTGTLVSGDNWWQPVLQNIPQAPVQFATVSRERLATLATSRRNRIGDFGWAAIGGFIASLPATVHDLIEAYLIDNPIGLSATRLLDVVVTIFFLALIVGALLRDRGQSAHQLLQEIVNPTTAHKDS